MTDRPASDLADENQALRAENARLRAGADPTPCEEAAQYSPGQLWHRLTTVDPADRLQLLGRMCADLDTAHRCFLLDHDGQVEQLKVTRDRYADATDALREIVNVLGPDQLCTCDGPDLADCGLRDEAADALRVARAALGETPT